MPRFINAILLFLFLCSLSACSSSKIIEGKYATNFADLGFFGTTVILKKDSTLDYKFSGDMVFHLVHGKYKIYNKKLYILFDKEILDSNFARAPLFDNRVKLFINKQDTIAYRSMFYIGHQKLFYSDVKTGEKITKAKRYNKRKKYFFFGSHYYKKKHYLRKIK